MRPIVAISHEKSLCVYICRAIVKYIMDIGLRKFNTTRLLQWLFRKIFVIHLKKKNIYQYISDMLSQCLVPSITKKVNSDLLVLGRKPLIGLQIQNFH